MNRISPIASLPVVERPKVEKAEKKYHRGGKPSKAETRALHEKIMELREKGYARFEIAEIVGVSRATVGKHTNGKIQGT